MEKFNQYNKMAPRRPLRTGRSPASWHSGSRWSSARWTTWPSYGRDGRRFGAEDSGERRRLWRPLWRGARSYTHVDCDERQRPGPGWQCSPLPSMGRNWGLSNDVTSSSCGMATIPRTSQHTAMAVSPISPSVPPLTAKRAASSRRVTMSSVTG